MKKISNINCYVKNGKAFIVINIDGVAYSINLGLLKYVINNPKQVKEKNKED